MKHLPLFMALTLLTFPPTGTAFADPRPAISLYGDLKYGQDFKHFAYVNPDAPKGGTLQLSAIGSFDNLNPYIIKGEGAEGVDVLTNVTLMTQSYDEPFSMYAQLADTVDLADDRASITFHLNPKAVWDDGTPITAEDVVWTFTTLTKDGAPFYRAYYADVDAAKAITAHSVTFTFKTTTNRELPLILAQMPILPKHYWAGKPFGETTLTPPVASGPYKISRVVAGRSIEFTRNPNWWGAKPRLDSISYQVLDDSARIPALRNNAIDATGVGSVDELVLARRTKGVDIRSAPSVGWSHLTFNGAPGSILADKALRHAIALGIDRQTIVTVMEHGLIAHPVPLNNRIYVQGQQGYQDNSAGYGYDPAAAARQLDELGWKLLPGKRVRERDGKQLVVRDIFYDAQATRQIGQIAQKTLGDIGVKLDLVPASGADLFSRYVIPGNFDIAEFSWVGDAFPLGSLTQIYAADGESNFGKIGSPGIDAKIDETLNDLDPVRARVSANELDRMLWAETFSLPLAQSPGNVAVRSTLANYGAAGLGDLNYSAIGFIKQ